MNQETETRLLLQFLDLIQDNQEISLDDLTEQDWFAMIRRIHQHRIAPLTYHNLSQNKQISNIPDDIAHDLQLDYFQCSLSNIRIYHELSKILKSAEDNNISIIVLKGAALAGLVYPSHALRPMNDLDLLIKPEHIHKANDILTRLGWRCKTQENLLEMLNQQGADIEYAKESILIDLHTAIRELPSSDPWANSKHKNIASLNMQILGYEDMIMHLCLHIYRHIQTTILLGGYGVTSLIRFYDIVLLLRKFRDEINWNYIVRASKLNQSDGGLYVMLNIVNRDLGEHIPEDVLSELKGNTFDLPINSVLYSNRKMSKIVCFLISNKLTKHFGSMLALHNAHPQKYTIGWFANCVFKSLFPGKEYLVMRYKIKHPSLFGFYYPIRIASAIWMFLKAIPSYIKSYRTIMKRHIDNPSQGDQE